MSLSHASTIRSSLPVEEFALFIRNTKVGVACMWFMCAARAPTHLIKISLQRSLELFKY